MNKSDVTDLILQRKREKGLTWVGIAESVGLSEVFVTSACLGMDTPPADKAAALATTSGEAAPSALRRSRRACRSCRARARRR